MSAQRVMKFRALLGDRFLNVEAPDELAAQEAAFAQHVAGLTPADFTVWPTGSSDDWATEGKKRK